MKKLNKKGFTLIELIVVIAILAILAAILIPAVSGYISKANDTRDQANCRALYSQTQLQVLLGQSVVLGTTDLTVTYTLNGDSSAVATFKCTKGASQWAAPSFTKGAITTP